MNKENIDFLTESGVKIRQAANGYRFTSDAIALADFVKCNPKDIVIDAGCGGGVISLIINDRFKPKRIIAVDIDKTAASLAQGNAALNKMTNIEAYCHDIRTFHKCNPEANSQTFSEQFLSDTNISKTKPDKIFETTFANIADVLVCNPPYFSNGPKSPQASRASARHDDTLSLEELAVAATRLLKYNGLLYICYPVEQIARAIQVLENNNFRVKELKLLPHLILIQAKKSKGYSSTKVIY